ncbi:hypothetical protein [Marinimicrococcus flavescens]|uniref:Uncharacterized protein n=1 Tax=Marinimicrococcus flavescens TaxID=3031815 RepID=A0AAP3XST6_9PROT|nr:hypothetical protein [Marinimicrococcus flavescens]
MSHAGGIVAADAQELPADAPAVRQALVATGDAMAGPGEAGELLDVEVEQLAGLVVLVPADGLCRLQAAPTADAMAPEDAAGDRRGDAGLGGDPLAGPALAPQREDLILDGPQRPIG